MNSLSKDEAVLLGLLSQLKHGVLRTKFVKLVYLIDNLRAEHLGEPLTSFRYHWDHYGPNALGNQIVESLESLSRRGLVRQTRKLTPYENYASYYAATAEVEPVNLPLSADDWAFIRAVVKAHGSKSRSQVVSAAKATLPMRRARQYALLTLGASPEIEHRQKKAFSNQSLAKQAEEALASQEPGIPLDELKALYAESR